MAALGDGNGMYDLAQHHEELIADNERQAARIARLEAALRPFMRSYPIADDAVTQISVSGAALRGRRRARGRAGGETVTEEKKERIDEIADAPGEK